MCLSVFSFDIFLALINIWTLNTKVAFMYTVRLSGVNQDWN
jgi:hypothetical protein